MQPSDQALLMSRLYVPIVVREILESPAAPADDMVYSLHSVFSDFRPDSALLAAALCTQEILAHGEFQSPQGRVLEMACSKVIKDYAPEWMETFEDQQSSEMFLMEVLEDVAEDLEGLSDLLKTVLASEQDEKLRTLLQVLQVQTHAQAAIADEFVNLMDCEFMQGSSQPVNFNAFLPEDDQFSELDMDVAGYGDTRNVVDFPLN